MPSNKVKIPDYEMLRSTGKGGGGESNSGSRRKPVGKEKNNYDRGLINLRQKNEGEKDSSEAFPAEGEETPADFSLLSPEKTDGENILNPEDELSYSELRKYKKNEKKAARDFELLTKDYWLARNGHTLTYFGLFLFSLLVFFRPYELIPQLKFLSTAAFFFAALTLAVYLPTQLLTEGNLSVFPTEVKAILVMTALAIITMPIAKDPAMAWETFNEMFIKAVLMFIVMVNVVRTRVRLLGLMWLSLSVGVYLSFTALDMFLSGKLNAEGYRVFVEVGGLFGNPNDMALHLVMMTPLAITLGIAARTKTFKFIYFLMAVLFIGANTVTYSRGGFLGLLAVTAILVWKLGRKNRFKILLISGVVAILFIALAPGNYGQRMLSIFNPSLDAVGSSDQRKELLIRSIIVTLRNPWGIGIGNFPIVGIRNLQTHNAFTQVSSEIGVLGLGAYLIFMLSPLRKLFAMERILWAKKELNWFYYLSIGLQASIVGFMVSSFFIPVAYNWFIYYLIAYAVTFRRMYRISRTGKDTEPEKESNLRSLFKLQKA